MLTVEDKTVDVTRHAEKRIRQRLGINKKATERNAEKALQCGVTHAEATGQLCKYLDGIFLRNYKPITVLPLPRNLWKLADKLQVRSKEAAK